MRPPKHVKVGPVTYRVKTGRAEIDRSSFVQGEPLDGSCDHGAAVITLAPLDSHDVMAVTCAHEVLHALWYLAGIGDGEESDTVEEDCVNRLAPLLVQLLRENPKLVAYLTDGAA